MSSRSHFFSEVSHAIDLKAEMTSRTKILTLKQWKSLKSLKESIPRSQAARIIDANDEIEKKWPVEYHQRLELFCIIIFNLTLPKSEHQNRQDKKTKVAQQTTLKCYKKANNFLASRGARGGGWVDRLGRWVVLS